MKPTVVSDRDNAYWGACSECGEAVHVSIFKANWVVCYAHRIMWNVGDNLFGGWQHETVEEQIRNVRTLDGFQVLDCNTGADLRTFDAEEAIEFLRQRQNLDLDSPPVE